MMQNRELERENRDLSFEMQQSVQGKTSGPGNMEILLLRIQPMSMLL